jgi:hypothetical protein
MTLISVEPMGDHWTVRSEPFANAMVFASGGRAEGAARRLGERLAAAGYPVEIRIHARGGAPVGRFVYTPRASGAPSRAPADAAPLAASGMVLDRCA